MKGDDKQVIKNYRPMSILPTYGKVFERLLYDVNFDFFQEITFFLQSSEDLD